MAITRTFFKNSFTVSQIPEWTCPTCNRGLITTDDKNIKTYESSTSKSQHKDKEWEPHWISGIFLGLFKCNNPKCNEIIVVTGSMQLEEDDEYDEQNGRYDIVRNEYLTPSCFNPPLHIFQIHKDIPKQIRNEIVNAFNIYWIDTASAANKIRVVTELVMDDMKIPKTFIDKKKKRVGYTLHKRIELFKLGHSEEAEQLMAIKWIGNSGSHTNNSSSLTKDDILDGFEILEHVTTKLYETESVRIKKLSKSINKRKKPIGKPQPKKGSLPF